MLVHGVGGPGRVGLVSQLLGADVVHAGHADAVLGGAVAGEDPLTRLVHGLHVLLHRHHDLVAHVSAASPAPGARRCLLAPGPAPAESRGSKWIVIHFRKESMINISNSLALVNI